MHDAGIDDDDRHREDDDGWAGQWVPGASCRAKGLAPATARAPVSRAWDLVAADVQRELIVPHCPRCTRPCCALTDVVLDLSFHEVRALYRIEKSQRDFDRALPLQLKKAQGRYFAHQTPCPAFESATHRCTVYGTADKPQGCTDFPVYRDGDGLTVDLRCEAAVAALPELQARASQAVGEVVQTHDEQFPDAFVRLERVGRRRR